MTVKAYGSQSENNISMKKKKGIIEHEAKPVMSALQRSARIKSSLLFSTVLRLEKSMSAVHVFSKQNAFIVSGKINILSMDF